MDEYKIEESESRIISRNQQLMEDIDKIEQKIKFHEKIINVLLGYINEQGDMINKLQEKIYEEEYYNILAEDDIPH